MTERELLLEKIRALNQYLSMLTNDKWSDKEIGLPKGVSRMEEVDRVLDLILEYRRKLKNA
ncbi:MAG: hypothetical protein IT258_16435 [Saprospiraceae bacterium]|nr:hypothetical protein [Saprospiraceae bacterium]